MNLFHEVNPDTRSIHECDNCGRGISRGTTCQKCQKAKRKAHELKRQAQNAEALAIVKTGKCPRCGRPLKRNLSLAGWWQCSQLGAIGFRADASQPSCDFQTFTE